MREKKKTITRVCPASDKGRDSLRAHLFLQLCFCSTGRCPGNSSHSPLFLLHSYPSAHAHLLLFSLSVMSDSFATPCCNPPGSSVRGILQARVLEWVAISYSRGSSRPRDRAAHVSYSAGGLFTSEPPGKPSSSLIQIVVSSARFLR